MAGQFLDPVLKCIRCGAYASDAQGKAVGNVTAYVFGMTTGGKEVLVNL